jgi:hypothetical protein
MISSCKSDPRIIVPKHPKWMGWTLNLAHARAVPITLLLIALLAVPVWAAAFMGAGTGPVVVTLLITTAILRPQQKLIFGPGTSASSIPEQSQAVSRF